MRQITDLAARETKQAIEYNYTFFLKILRKSADDHREIFYHSHFYTALRLTTAHAVEKHFQTFFQKIIINVRNIEK